MQINTCSGISILYPLSVALNSPHCIGHAETNSESIHDRLFCMSYCMSESTNDAEMYKDSIIDCNFMHYTEINSLRIFLSLNIFTCSKP